MPALRPGKVKAAAQKLLLSLALVVALLRWPGVVGPVSVLATGAYGCTQCISFEVQEYTFDDDVMLSRVQSAV